MNKTKHKLIKLTVFSLIALTLSFLAIPAEAASYVTSEKVQCTYKDNTQREILVKYNSENKYVKKEIGDKTLMTTQSLCLPYVACILHGNGVYWANYQVKAINDATENHIAYIISHKMQEFKLNEFKKEKGDPVQIAVWYSDANSGSHDMTSLVNDIAEDITNGDKNKAKEKIAEGKKLYDEGKEYEAYRALYKKNPLKKNKDGGKLNSKGVIGPFNMQFTEKESMNIIWGGITGYYLTGKNDNDRLVYKNDWIFTDANGNEISKPKSNVDFYIKILNKNITHLGKLHFDFKQTYAKGTWIPLHSTRTDVTQQDLMIIEKGERGTFTEALDFNVNLDLDFELAGNVFIDVKQGKDNTENGKKDNNDKVLKGITVELMNSSTNKVVATTTTDNSGYYKFKAPANATYYVRFKYNGQLYEPTTYALSSAKVEERSYATDGIANRQVFNKKFSPVTVNTKVTDADKQIYAYTGNNGNQGTLKTYGMSTSESERLHINFGLMEREQANLTLSKDLWEVNLSINGKNQKYIYNNREKEDMKVQLRGTDVAQYERQVRKADISYTGTNPLEITLTYRIRIHNASGYIAGEVNQVSDYYDNDYIFVKSYKDPNKKDTTAVKWTQNKSISGNGYTYKSMTTNGYSTGKLPSGSDSYIYTEFKVNQNAIKDLLNTNSKTKENYAQIDSYATYYIDTRKDLNGERVMHSKDEVAGLIDINSTPGNFNPTKKEVEQFVHVTSKTDAYKKKTNAEKVKLSYAVFEDDADVAPSLKLTLSNGERKITGFVWEDTPIKTNLDKNIRKGDGIRKTQIVGSTQNDPVVQGVTVKLYTKDGKDTGITATTDNKGYYELKGFIPGDYVVRFQYGDTNKTSKTYNGQDYKSTIYQDKIANDNYWYTKANDNKSDATDDMARREAVNGYSKDLNNANASVLNKNNTTNEAELIAKTNMIANTPAMTMDVEYARDTTTFGQNVDYVVGNVDFGLVQRPISQLVLKKNVEHIKVLTNDGQIIFDSTEQGPNLAWIKDEYIQATIDDSLIHGSTIEISYKMEIVNESEKNYVIAKTNAAGQVYKDDNGEIVYTEDPTFYKGSGETHNSKAVLEKTRATKIVDYIENNLYFNSQLNTNWKIIDKTALTNTDPKLSWVDNKVYEKIKDYHVIIEANKEENKAENQTKSPLTESLTPGEKRQDTLYLSKVMALDDDNSDSLTYKNTMEILGIHQDSGRRQEESIVGNFDPTEETPEEKDTAISEKIIILGPFGNQNIIYIVEAIILSVILAGGIAIILTKVVKRKDK